MAKTKPLRKPPRQQPTGEVLRNVRHRAATRATATIRKKGRISKEAKRDLIQHDNADRAVKRFQAGKKKTAAKGKK